jgi:hypothetical protein
MSKTEEYLIETADRCVRLARAGREIAADLEAMSNDLMAKAVEIDSAKDRHESDERSGKKRAAGK